MKSPTMIAMLLVGVALGAGLVVACGDDSPDDADAAVCDCPAAEPPLQGRITSTTQVGTIDAGSVGTAGVGCASGSVLLGGGCKLDALDPLVHLVSSGIDRTVPTQPAYVCEWSSTSATTRTGTAEVICLTPAQ